MGRADQGLKSMHCKKISTTKKKVKSLDMGIKILVANMIDRQIDNNILSHLTMGLIAMSDYSSCIVLPFMAGSNTNQKKTMEACEACDMIR